MSILRSILTRVVKSPKTTGGVILGVATLIGGHTYSNDDVETIGLVITALSGLLGKD